MNKTETYPTYALSTQTMSKAVNKEREREMLTEHLVGELPASLTRSMALNSLIKSCAFDAFWPLQCPPCNSHWHPNRQG